MKLTFLPAHTLAKIIRERHVSCEEVVTAYLQRISQYNPQLKAIVTLDTDKVYQQAKKCDQVLAQGNILGPLANYIPQQDATVVTKLKAAGAIILGKTNTPKLTGDFQTNSPLFGRTNNPWNLDYTPGGSTGGGAAAIAARLSPLEIGSDLGGSLRVTAHFCGICTLKPTEHRVSTFGHIPELPGVPKRIKHLQNVGPLARSIEDLHLCLSIIEGVDIQQSWVKNFREIFDPIKSLKSFRFALIKGFGQIPVCSETNSALESLGLSLTELGCHLEKSQPNNNFSCLYLKKLQKIVMLKI